MTNPINTDSLKKELQKNLAVVKNLFPKKKTGKVYVQTTQFVAGLYELVSDGIKIWADQKVTPNDLIHLLDFNVYVKAFDNLGIMFKSELVEMSEADFQAILKEGRDAFIVDNNNIEENVQRIVEGIMSALRLRAVVTEKSDKKA